VCWSLYPPPAFLAQGRGFDKAIEEGKARMKRYNNQATPNMLVIAPETALYVSTNASDRLKFIEGGERAITDFQGGVAGFEAKAFRGLGIFESNPFDAGENVDAMQPLNRHTQVGEWYEMCAPMIFAKKEGEDGSKGYESLRKAMAIQIFDEVRDRLETITFAQVRKHLHMDAVFANYPGGAAAANEEDPLGLIAFSSGNLTAKSKPSQLSKETVDAWRSLNTSAPTFTDYADSGSWTNLYEQIVAGKWTPFRVVLARPFIEHTMLSMVMAVSGRDTGAMLYGPSDMQISANTQVKTIEGYACLLVLELTHMHTLSTHFNTVARGPGRTHTLRAQRWLGYYGSSRTALGANRCPCVAFFQRGGGVGLCSLQKAQRPAD